LNTLEARKRTHSPLLAAWFASESENEKLPYGEDSPWLAAGRLQSGLYRVLDRGLGKLNRWICDIIMEEGRE